MKLSTVLKLIVGGIAAGITSSLGFLSIRNIIKESKDDILIRNQAVETLRFALPNESTLKVFDALELNHPDGISTVPRHFHRILNDPCTVRTLEEHGWRAGCEEDYFREDAAYTKMCIGFHCEPIVRDELIKQWQSLLTASRNSTFSKKVEPCEPTKLSHSYVDRYKELKKDWKTKHSSFDEDKRVLALGAIAGTAGAAVMYQLNKRQEKQRESISSSASGEHKKTASEKMANKMAELRNRRRGM